MFQAFEWHVPADQQHWNRLRESLPRLKAMGVTNIWIPPACKAMSPQGNGYDIYDLYDVGEFHQKGSRATKWGTREELEAFISGASALGIGIYWDAVLNHKAAADFTEKCMAIEVEPTGNVPFISSHTWIVILTYSIRSKRTNWETDRNRRMDGIRFSRPR